RAVATACRSPVLLSLSPPKRSIRSNVVASASTGRTHAPRWSRSRQRAVSAARRCLNAAVFSTMAGLGRRQSRSSNNDVSLPLNGYADLPASGRSGHSAPRFAERALRKYWPRSRRSFRLDVRCSDYVTPFLGFFRDELAEIGRRADHRCAAQLGKPCVELRVGETRVNGLVELVDDLRRRALGRADAEPAGHLVARQDIAHGRYVR